MAWMWDKLVDLFVWLGGQLYSVVVYLVNQFLIIIDIVIKFCVAFSGAVLGALTAWWGTIIRAVLTWGWSQMQLFLAHLMAMAEGYGVSINAAAIESSFHNLTAVYAALNWILPLNSMSAIIASSMGIVYSIRLIRWAMSFIPLLNTG